MDNFYGPLSVRITGFDCKYNETYDTIFELNWEKLGGGMGITRKERGLPLCFPSPDYRRLVNMYEFHILKSFYNTKKYVVITCVCTY